jgi:hypothetical protein
MPCLSSLENVRRTAHLFEMMDKLEELTLLCLQSSQEKADPENAKVVSGGVLRDLSDFKIRKICGEVIHRVGLQIYNQHGVADAKFAENSLYGKIEMGGNDSRQIPIQFFRPRVTLDRVKSRSIRSYGECQCRIADEGNLCPHMSALLIAWVREPREFKEDPEYLISNFEKARMEVRGSLGELLGSMENMTRAEALDILQKIYTKIRQWRSEIKEFPNDSFLAFGAKKFDPICELSAEVNYVSLAVLSAIQTKYKLRTIDIYNSGTLTTFGAVLKLFVDNTRYNDKSFTANKQQKRSKKNTDVDKETARTWDLLVENFSKGD